MKIKKKKKRIENYYYVRANRRRLELDREWIYRVDFPLSFSFPFGPFALRLCFSWKYKLNPLFFSTISYLTHTLHDDDGYYK
jgi:hypothetical protein